MKNYKYPFIFLLVLTVCSGALNAQWNFALFNLQGVPQSSALNPGRMPLSDVYVAIPAAGYVNGRFSNAGFDLAALLPDNTGGSDFFDSDFTDIRAALGPQNRLLMDLQLNWVDAGFRVNKNFFSFTVSEQLQLQVDFPSTVFELFDDIEKELAEQTSKTYDLSNLGLYALHYRSYAFGYTRSILPGLSAGLRLKWLSGLGSARTDNQALVFENNLQKLTVSVKGSLAFYTSGLGALENGAATYLRNRGNNGLALDAGVQFQPNEKIELFASILDLGSIRWKNELNTDRIQAASFTPSIENIQNFEADARLFFDSLQSNTRSSLDPFQTRLPSYAYLGGNYFIAPHTSLGLLLSPRFFEGETIIPLSFNVQTRLRRILQLNVGYTRFPQAPGALGVGASLNLGPVQVFAATDNILSALQFQTSQQAHANVGMSLAFGRRTRAQQRALWQEDPSAEPSEQDGQPEAKPQKKAAQPARQAVEDPTPAPTQPTPQATATAPLNRFVVVSGTARTAQGGDAVKGIQADVFARLEDGTEKFVQTQFFFNGIVQIQLERGKSYRVSVSKNGVGKAETLISAAELEGKNVVEKVFIFQ